MINIHRQHRMACFRLSRTIAGFVLIVATMLSPLAAFAQEPSGAIQDADASAPMTRTAETGGSAAATVMRQTRVGNTINTVTRFSSVKDSYIASAYPNTNFSTSNTLYLGWNQSNQKAMRILIQFDLSSIPKNAQIKSATYSIYQINVSPSGDGAMDFRGQYMQQDWLENTVNWNNANYLGGTSLPLGTFHSGIGWQSGPATDLVRSWVSGAEPNRGLLITGDETPERNRFRQFYSRRQPGYVPYLEVEYETTCDTLPPDVRVTAQPQYQPESFRVYWGGQDFAPSNCTPSGIAYYDVQYRINGGGWVAWKNQTQSTDNNFNFAGNGQYVEWRARAADKTGNVQPWGDVQTSTIVDTEPPTSSMTPLPEYSVTTSFFVNWSGSDALSGVAYYDVQARKLPNDWQTLLEETNATEFHVTGAENGVTYQGRVRAVDRVGNVQPWPESPQVQTTVFAYPVADMLPFNPPILKPTATVTDSFPAAWAVYFAPGTTIASFTVYYNYNSQGWQTWATFPGNQTSATFPFRSLGRGDGLYEFEVTATNNLAETESRTFVSEASMVVDIADAMQPINYLPIIATSPQ